MNESGFVSRLQNYASHNVNPETLDLLEPYLAMSDFNFRSAERSSGNVAGLCLWVRAQVSYAEIEKRVRPIKIEVESQQAALEVNNTLIPVFSLKMIVRVLG